MSTTSLSLRRSSRLTSASTSQQQTKIINWCFFDPEHPVFEPRPIKIPTELYESCSMNCRKLFRDELRREYDFVANIYSIKFWRPKTALNLDLTEEELQNFLHFDPSKHLPIHLAMSFSYRLTDVGDKNVVHLIITAKAAQKQTEELDIVGPQSPVFPSPRDRRKAIFLGRGRPVTQENKVPLVLLDSIFGQFLDDCENVNLTSEDIDFVSSLKTEMSEFSEQESVRRVKFRTMLEGYGIKIVDKEITIQSQIETMSYYADGCVLYNNRPILILDVKNEMYEMSSEPSIQATLYYKALLTDALWEDESTCHPCFLIILVGSYIGIAGYAFTDHIITESFSFLSFSFHSDDTRVFERLARHMLALKNAVHSLENAFIKAPASTPPIPESELPPYMFPYKKSFGYLVEDTIQSTTFSYEEKRNDGRLLYNGLTGNGDAICIKFVEKYGKEVHQLCAKNGFAPKLLGVENLPGGWVMVVMERLDNSWICLFDFKNLLNEDQKDILREGIRTCLKLLHDEGMVHGDLRDVNVMLKKDEPSQFRLIDFDWAGKVNEARYPKDVNVDPILGRPPDVKAFETIEIEHDKHMLEGLCR